MSAINTKLIGEIADLLTASDLNEIEIEKGDLRIRVSKETIAKNGSVSSSPTPAPAIETESSPPAPVSEIQTQTVPSPMVGTVYLSPSPGADPFVRVGQSVKKGQTLMILEAMKTMNPIPAPCDGIISSIVVEDGQPVEFSEPLILFN